MNNMSPIRHHPTEASEEMPSGKLGIFAYGSDSEGVYCVYLYEPNTIPLRGYEYRIDEGEVYDVIEDLEIDRYASAAQRVCLDFFGDFEALKALIHTTPKIMKETHLDFENALHYLKTGQIRRAVSSTLSENGNDHPTHQTY